MTPLLLNAEQVAEMIGVTLSTARRLMVTGEIPCVVIPGRNPNSRKKMRRARPEDVEAFINRNLSRTVQPLRTVQPSRTDTARIVHTPRGDYKRYI
jgi:antitoxin component of RelBE/YafQ-DinJ toxin-antitoxin module